MATLLGSGFMFDEGNKLLKRVEVKFLSTLEGSDFGRRCRSWNGWRSLIRMMAGLHRTHQWKTTFAQNNHFFFFQTFFYDLKSPSLWALRVISIIISQWHGRLSTLVTPEGVSFNISRVNYAQPADLAASHAHSTRTARWKLSTVVSRGCLSHQPREFVEWWWRFFFVIFVMKLLVDHQVVVRQTKRKMFENSRI